MLKKYKNDINDKVCICILRNEIMKLKEWAEKQGIAYLTAWRWFKAGDPRLSNAYQSDSGTIIVPEDMEILEQPMSTNQTNDVMSAVLKKTVEFSKNNGSIEEFAAWILSNFSLRSNTYSEAPKYSRNKPKAEEVQKHFKQFLTHKAEKPKQNMFVVEPEVLDDLITKSDNLTTQELVDEINKIGVDAGVQVNPAEVPEVYELMHGFAATLDSMPTSSVVNYNDVTEGVITRSVDLTPQSLNYTGSSDSAFGNSFNDNLSYPGTTLNVVTNGTFKPTQKELDSVNKVSVMTAVKSKRGRKPSK